MPATIEAPTRTEQVFTSKAANFVTVRAQAIRRETASGAQETLSPGRRYEFTGGVFRVTDAVRAEDEWFWEHYGHLYPADGPGGSRLSPEDWLRKRGQETGKITELAYQAPDASEELQAVAMLAIEGDREMLQRALDEERAGHDRPELVAAIVRALEKLAERDAA